MIKRWLSKRQKNRPSFDTRIGLLNEESRKIWLAKTLKKIAPGLRILDAGAGECQFKALCSHLDYVSQDFSQYDGSGASGLQTGTWNTSSIDVVSDIAQIPLPDASFDVIMCTEVLEHVPDPLMAMREFDRLLKPAGQLIITAPNCSLTHFAPYHFASGFNRYFYEHHLNNMGFEINELSPNGNYFEYMAQEIRRIESIGIKYSKSKGLSRVENEAMDTILSILDSFSSDDTGSDELLCFGFHVLATKRAHRDTAQ